MASANKFNDQSVEELRLAYADLSRDLFRINSDFKLTRHLEKPHRLKMLKRDRARALTALHAKGSKLN
ncbi:MAG: 50S ribosomal protein L29 [Chlamydiota bacterium]